MALAIGLAACGGDDGDGGGGGSGDADIAFLEAMIPHHQSAAEMATVARRRAERPEIRELAHEIITTQTSEMRQIRQIHKRSFGGPVLPNADAHAVLGLSAEEAGMAHMDSTGALKGADPFDRAFIDAMVPHHQGAIRMAHAVLNDTDNAEVRSLATAIIDAQSREIRQMNRWRLKWYGNQSPAGGVPAEAGDTGGSGSGEHDGH
jgi:uncharacterized protein (DUF305 family)